MGNLHIYVHVCGNKQWPRFVVRNSRGQLWTGDNWTTEPRDALLFNSDDEALAKVSELTLASTERMVVTTVAIRVDREKPFTIVELQEFLGANFRGSCSTATLAAHGLRFSRISMNYGRLSERPHGSRFDQPNCSYAESCRGTGASGFGIGTAIDSYFYERSKVGDQQAFPHTLLTGPSGTGKTLLSETISRDLCVTLHSELAQNLRTPEHVHALLMMLEPGDCLFIDEIHELKHQVTIYRALEEGKLFLGKRHVIKLPPFCLIGATTHEFYLHRSMLQKLPDTLVGATTPTRKCSSFFASERNASDGQSKMSLFGN